MNRGAENELDSLRILAGLGIPDAHLIARQEGGMDTSIWRVLCTGKMCALRVLRPNQEGRSRREVAAMRAAKSGGVPVPEVLATGNHAGHPVLLLSWMPGHTLAEAARIHPERS